MKVKNFLLDLLFPRKCPFCQTIQEPENSFSCRHCHHTLPWMHEQGQVLENAFFECIISPFYYQDTVREAIHRYKFEGHRTYADIFGEILARKIKAQLDVPIDLVTHAPISAKRLKKRGYDQGALLAAATAKSLNLPFYSLLEKTKDTPPQSSLDSFKKRKENAAGVYQCKSSIPLKGKFILLIDDVYTSGSTLSECAKQLFLSDAERVFCATIAYVNKKI